MRNDRGYLQIEEIALIWFIVLVGFCAVIAFLAPNGNGVYRHTNCAQASNANFVICKSDYDTLTLDKRKIVDILFDKKDKLVNVHYCKPAGDDTCADFALEAKTQAEADKLTDLLSADPKPS